MTTFVVLQILFDAVLAFSFLFLFHYAVNRARARREEEDLLRGLQVQEIKEDLQELLVSLKQVGGETSRDLQARVREATEKGEALEALLEKLRRELAECGRLASDLQFEKEQLAARSKMIRNARKRRKAPFASEVSPSAPGTPEGKAGGSPPGDRPEEGKTGRALGFPQGAVREIYRMADDAMEVGEIARRTQLTRGEVQLILNLRGNRFTTTN